MCPSWARGRGRHCEGLIGAGARSGYERVWQRGLVPWVLARTGFDAETKEKPGHGVRDSVVGVLQADFEYITPTPLERTRGGFKGTINCMLCPVCIYQHGKAESKKVVSTTQDTHRSRTDDKSHTTIMANVAGRKKSIASNPGLVIETPVANNNILNKAASASTSLYQQCSSLRARLMRIPDFSHFFILSSPNGDLRQSTDPVTQVWDCFTLGIPLCFLFNLLPLPTRPIAEISTDPATFDLSNEKEKKRAIAKFAMRLSEIDNCERFTVSDLWDRHSTDGLVKV